MEVEEMFYYDLHVVQRWTDGLIGSWEEDKLFIRIKLYKCNSWHLDTAGVQVLMGPLLALIDFSVKFSHIKQQLCDSDLVEYETLIFAHLKSMGVREYEHPAILEKIFIVVEAAVSPVDAVVVIVSDVTSIHADLYHDPFLTPASRSSIQGLEPMTVADGSQSSCAICLDDFEGKPITRLPCTHHFHVDCIVQWLEINHLCPYCRYPLRTQEDSVCGILHSVWSFVQCIVLVVCNFMVFIWEHPLLQ